MQSRTAVENWKLPAVVGGCLGPEPHYALPQAARRAAAEPAGAKRAPYDGGLDWKGLWWATAFTGVYMKPQLQERAVNANLYKCCSSSPHRTPDLKVFSSKNSTVGNWSINAEFEPKLTDLSQDLLPDMKALQVGIKTNVLVFRSGQLRGKK